MTENPIYEDVSLPVPELLKKYNTDLSNEIVDYSNDSPEEIAEWRERRTRAIANIKKLQSILDDHLVRNNG
jgi:hypothetical protein